MAATLPAAVHGEFLLCGLCSDTLQRPKLLPCNHTYCQGCLQRLLQKSTTATAHLWFLCPTCRSITEIPPQGVAAFRTNHFILGLKRIVASSTRRRNSPDRINDRRNLADQAAGVNRRSQSTDPAVRNGETGTRGGRSHSEDRAPTTGHHKRTNSNGSSDGEAVGACAGARPKSVLRPGGTLVQCDCKEEEVRFSCLQCDKMVCGACMSEHHKTHNVLRIEDHANKERDLALAIVHNSRKDTTELHQALADLEKYKKSLRRSRDEARAGVKAQVEFLKRIITDLEASMLKDIENVFTDESGNADKMTKHYKEMTMLTKSFTDFSGKLLGDASHSEVIAWRKHLELQYKDIHSGIKMSGVDLIRKQPVHIRHVTEADACENYCKNTTKKLMGKVQYGRNIEIIDLNMNRGGNIGSSTTESHLNGGASTPSTESKPIACDKVLATTIHEGRLQRSFSAFTDGSKCQPMITGIAVTPEGSIVVVDQNNKCVKFFTPSGGMPCKIHGSESLWDATVLSDGNIAVTDKTVHVFDSRGRQVKVLRQQPRDSHGACVTSGGDIVVTDCTSRCIYTLAAVGGTIKRILTLHGRTPFRAPRYVTVNIRDDVIVSDTVDNLVVLFNDSGQVVWEYGGGEGGPGVGELDNPAGVCTDKLGNVLICDQNNDRVVLLDSAGNFLCNVLEGSENIERPAAVAVDKDGRMVVAQEDGRIKIFDYLKPT